MVTPQNVEFNTFRVTWCVSCDSLIVACDAENDPRNTKWHEIREIVNAELHEVKP